MVSSQHAWKLHESWAAGAPLAELPAPTPEGSWSMASVAAVHSFSSPWPLCWATETEESCTTEVSATWQGRGQQCVAAVSTSMVGCVILVFLYEHPGYMPASKGTFQMGTIREFPPRRQVTPAVGHTLTALL